MRHLFFFLAFFIPSLAFSQIGGTSIFEFTNLPVSARLTGAGGNLISVMDDDLNLAHQAPSLINPSMDKKLAFNSSVYFSGISTGYVGYGFKLKPIDMQFVGGVQFINYGTFDQTDEFGNILGDFKASEYALHLGGAFAYSENLNFGINLKPVFSYLESYQSFGLLGDISATYSKKEEGLYMTLLFKHFGRQFSTYQVDNVEPVPFDIQFGVSKKLKHLPFRFSVIAHHLNQWDIRYDDPNAEEASILFGEEETTEPSYFADKLFRHFIFSGEFLIGKQENFRFLFGYNHLRRQEMRVGNLRGLGGFSLGLGLKVKRFRIEYGASYHHQAGAQNQFSISTNLSEFKR